MESNGECRDQVYGAGVERHKERGSRMPAEKAVEGRKMYGVYSVGIVERHLRVQTCGSAQA